MLKHLAMQRNGVPKAAVDCLFSTLQNATHQVRTGYGDSTSSYGGSCWLIPLHGIGQGNGAGPAIWAVVSTPLLNILRKKGYGCDIINPISGKCYKFVGYAFVDNTDLVAIKAGTFVTKIIRDSLKASLDTWEGTLKASCGAIVPEKTFWFLIDFNWKSGNWRYASITDHPADLHVNDINGNRQIIRRYDPWEAQETLGIYLAPDGNTKKKYGKMLTLATEWADKMRTGRLSKADSWLAIMSTIMRTLAYPLSALNLTEAQYDDLLRPIVMYGLPAMGICRHFARDIVFAPKLYRGTGLKHLYIQQEIHVF